jgi:GNAT superfamily N-acetyltransferase
MGLSVKKCQKKHWKRILEIRNSVRHSFINTSLITLDSHKGFMEKHAGDYIVAIQKGEVVGFAGVVDNDIRVAVDPSYQKLGIGKKLLEKISSQFPAATAKIDIKNLASLALFESCGFAKEYFLLGKE